MEEKKNWHIPTVVLISVTEKTESNGGIGDDGGPYDNGS